MTSREYADGLRQIASWVEAHPEIVPPPYPEVAWHHLETAEEAAHITRALGTVKKHGFTPGNEGAVSLVRMFGAIAFRVTFWRKDVCTRRVVGTEHVPEQVVAAHTKEIVEWDCHPILARAALQAEPASL
jgi:hypothetical protein